MQAANLQATVALSRVMYDLQHLQLTKGERILAQDAFWWRLFCRLHPSVRKDMVGWMGLARLADIKAHEEASSFNDAVMDFAQGAGQALNPLPISEPSHYQSDRAALAADALAVSSDFAEVVVVASKLAEAAAQGGADERRRKAKADAAE